MDISRERYIFRTKEQIEKSKNKLTPKYEELADRYSFIWNWKPQTDIWPLSYSRSILVSMATLTGIYLNHRFRARLKMRNYGAIPTFIGVTTTSAATTAYIHTEFVLNKLLLLEIPCALCLESQSALLQSCTGVFLPLILIPFGNFSIAAGSGVYNVPHISDIKGIFRTIFSTYQPLIPKIVTIFTFQTLIAGFLTYSEIKSYLRVLDLQYLLN
ncbi:uncharacterized protein LOC105425474 [Pogonomyrmex barbatus]|uniref:Uncharacterized protein LOC105425474 n=1 Tax=Pogonomyrmex barbatus TaxID=144034 RepID=A0A6I9W0V7_9HYME|nr:uncharacterized protein LOC105425474 [Pogonomyrmex barbatus]